MRANTSPWGEMMTRVSELRALAGALLLASTLGACDSPTPLAQTEGQPEEPAISMTSVLEGKFSTQAVVRCVVTVATEVVTCTSPQDPDAGAPPPLGGYGNHVRLLPSSARNVSDSLYFRMRMRVQNLLPQTIGTHSGPITGMRVFFHGLPVTTGGTGTVTVANADGTAEFTAVGQPYFQYDTKVASLEASGFEWWRFNVPASVNSFRFDVYVSTLLMPMVVFDMEVAGNRDVYVVNVDGSGLLRLTTSPAVDMTPTAAFERVVFVSYRDGNAELYSVPINGGAQTRLTFTTSNETEPALPASNTKLAFISDVSGMPRIMVGDADGGDAVGSTVYGHGAAVEASPAWLVGHNQLTYMSTGNNTAGLFRLTLSNAKAVRLIGGPRTRFNPAVSPDGALVAHVVATTDATNSEVWIYDRNADALTRFTQRRYPDRHPTFLHDGRIGWQFGLNGGGYRLRWSTLDGASAQTVSTGTGDVTNPFGVPLRP